ncbi:MAG TPA: ABC transporter transmembrane domain-containing protein, partial [Acidimicrobiales bacterium]|nr:ABC transporter transmembrane domain-containing protein [Acidimicrobiales bacterium]
MLTRLLRDRLRPYRRTLLWVAALQTVQTAATLTLPTLNARIIDQGILKHNEHYIVTTGGVMLAFSAVQVTFAVAAVYLGAKVSMKFGRDLRNALFHTVTGFSAREVGSFGAPSLITRITNDV